VPILRSVKNQGAYTNSYTILKKSLLILLFISCSLEDEADQNQNEVQEITKDTNQNTKYKYCGAILSTCLFISKKNSSEFRTGPLQIIHPLYNSSLTVQINSYYAICSSK
jgi:hypothetical protein